VLSAPQAVQQCLNTLGHNVVELERGSLATRIWRDVKRKRVRIPDLCCTRCGVRIESRAKTSADLAMSHSPSDAERAWHYGMLDSDWIAFPILSAVEGTWSAGSLDSRRSLWRERTLTSWRVEGRLNLFTVAAFRGVAPKQLKPKGVSEGSEVQVRWKARFAPGSGEATTVAEGRLDYVLDDASSKARHFRLGTDEQAFVTKGDRFELNEVVAGQLAPLRGSAARCAGGCDSAKLKQMLASRERTVRFTGCKLARFAKDADLADQIRELAFDAEEDAYVRMEAKSYLCEVVGAGSKWPTWTLAHLPKDAVAPHIAALQARRPDIHYAVSVIWTFLESWIAQDWTPRSTP
jgi:hypothetical protein